MYQYVYVCVYWKYRYYYETLIISAELGDYDAEKYTSYQGGQNHFPFVSAWLSMESLLWPFKYAK